MGVQIGTQTDDDLNKTDSYEWKMLLKHIINNKSRFKFDIFLNILEFQSFYINFKMFWHLPIVATMKIFWEYYYTIYDYH